MLQRVKTRPRSPEREALAAAQEALREAQTDLKAAQTAEAEAAAETRMAWAAMGDAQLALSDAADAGVQFALAKATGDVRERPLTAAEANAALEAATVRRADLKALEAALQERIPRLVLSAQLRKKRVQEASARIIAALPAAQQILADFQRLQRELVEKGQALNWLRGIGALDLENIRTGPSSFAFSPAHIALRDWGNRPDLWDIGRPAVMSSDCARLAAFYEALQVDPDAQFDSGR